MTVSVVLSVSKSYYDFDQLETQVRKIDSVQDRIECDYPCLAVTLPNAFGKKLHQKMTVIDFERLFQEINNEIVSTEAKIHTLHRRRALKHVILSIIGIIIGSILLKNSDFGSGNSFAGLFTLIGAGVLLLNVAVHYRGQLEASIVSLNKTITAFGEVLGSAKGLQSAINTPLSMPLKDWYKHFRSMHFSEASSVNITIKTGTVANQPAADNHLPLLPENFPDHNV